MGTEDVARITSATGAGWDATCQGRCPEEVRARSCFRPPRGVEDPDVAICRPPVKLSAARVREMLTCSMRGSFLLCSGLSGFL
jgi:hypothetical protein